MSHYSDNMRKTAVRSTFSETVEYMKHTGLASMCVYISLLASECLHNSAYCLKHKLRLLSVSDGLVHRGVKGQSRTTASPKQIL